MLNFIDRLFNEHKFVRRFGMVTVLAMDIAIVCVALYCILDAKPLPEGWTPILMEAFGLNAVYIAFYQWSRSKGNGGE